MRFINIPFLTGLAGVRRGLATDIPNTTVGWRLVKRLVATAVTWSGVVRPADHGGGGAI